MQMNGYWEGLKISLRQPALVNELVKAVRLHRSVEAEFRQRLNETLPDGDDRLVFPHLKLPPTQYFQRNFFSILFLSLFETLG
ncbi:MAG: hypothetical protein ACLGPL_08830, partial [Acidobacteriota bacterium]